MATRLSFFPVAERAGRRAARRRRAGRARDRRRSSVRRRRECWRTPGRSASCGASRGQWLGLDQILLPEHRRAHGGGRSAVDKGDAGLGVHGDAAVRAERAGAGAGRCAISSRARARGWTGRCRASTASPRRRIRRHGPRWRPAGDGARGLADARVVPRRQLAPRRPRRHPCAATPFQLAPAVRAADPATAAGRRSVAADGRRGRGPRDQPHAVRATDGARVLPGVATPGSTASGSASRSTTPPATTRRPTTACPSTRQGTITGTDVDRPVRRRDRAVEGRWPAAPSSTRPCATQELVRYVRSGARPSTSRRRASRRSRSASS